MNLTKSFALAFFCHFRYVRRHTFDYEQRLSGEINATCLARATVSHVKLPEKNSHQESDADVYSAPRIHFLYIKFRQAGTRVRFFFFPRGLCISTNAFM
uniref:Secreted protein n=1 Tax=Trichogramma kaykai TaxID=54128 RepID=A0ABD2X8C4_9HYME